MAQAKKEEFESEGKQTHTCNQCGRIFSSKRGLQIHRSKHSASSRCNRCGEGVSQGERRMRASKKVQLYCSAFANVHFKEDGSVSVIGCFGHIGHDLDPALLRWTDEQLEYLKYMIQEFSTDYIIQKMRKDYESKECKLYFVTKKDLWNVMTKYKLTPGLRDRDDVTSLELREQERNPSDGIRFFKKQDEPSGKGFVLVIITPRQQRWLDQFASKGIAVDDTHNVTRYALKLATVMVIDDRDRGLPAAFLLSGEMTAKEVKILFDEIKKIVPNFAPKSLVSDEALAFYNGFKSSFPDRENSQGRGLDVECGQHNIRDSVWRRIRWALLVFSGGQEDIVQEGQEEIVQERQEEIVQESTFIELQPELRELVMLHSERGHRSYTVIHAKVDALVRQEDEDAIGTLTALAERLRVIAGDTDVPLEAAGIVSRPDVPSHGQPKMQKSELYSRARIRKEMRKKTQSVEDIRMDSEEILFCSLCFEEDPALPEDMDLEEPDARETQWM
ncbi:hypothetical protein V3C99_018424 [Haemonchus contortus]